MLILEIILTIFVWRKGWKWYSLIPIVAAIVVGFMVGLSIGASGGSVEDLGGGTIMIDIAAIIALIIMLIKEPKNKEQLTDSSNVKTQA